MRNRNGWQLDFVPWLGHRGALETGGPEPGVTATIKMTLSRAAQVIVQQGGQNGQVRKRDKAVDGQAQDADRTGHFQGKNDG